MLTSRGRDGCDQTKIRQALDTDSVFLEKMLGGCFRPFGNQNSGSQMTLDEKRKRAFGYFITIM